MESSKEYYPIREWAEDDRPREKLLLKGRQSLSDAELIAILMGSGSRNESAVDLAKRILKESSDNLMELSKLSVQDLMKFKGVGEAKAISIIAALELGKRRRGAEAIERKKITSSKDVFEFFSSIVGDLTYETFYILLLNRANSIIRGVQISEGGISGTVADPKKIFKLALDHNATSIILCHNHPSGNVKPSQDDIALTKKIKRAGETMDISVLDHIIIGDEKYYSFADEGMM
jgi:DNA repair protein RadC